MKTQQAGGQKMIDAHEVRQQLHDIQADFRFWGRAEIRELPRILFDNERIHHAINGRYEGGFALLAATNRRVLLIDKKPFYLTLEDIRYDMISDVAYNHRLLDATVRLGTVHKSVGFKAYNHARLREMTNFIQQKVMEFRQQQQQQPVWQQLPEEFAQAYTAPAPPSPEPTQMVYTTAHPSTTNPYTSPLMIRRRVSRFY